jgi:hypothetical protein
MSRDRQSLLAGRNKTPLTSAEATRAVNVFFGLDDDVPARHDPDNPTRFVVRIDEDGKEVAEITFGADILPGKGVLDPNSMLGSKAAAAHELTHYYRWHDKSELPFGPLDSLDEALTSLQAILRYERNLQPFEIRQLVSDAVQRIMLYVEALPSDGPTRTDDADAAAAHTGQQAKTDRFDHCGAHERAICALRPRRESSRCELSSVPASSHRNARSSHGGRSVSRRSPLRDS